MMQDVEQVAVGLSEWLQRRDFIVRQALIGGMGSLRILDDDRFVISINNDRGLLAVTLGILPAPREQDRPAMVYWALCLGLRPIHAEVPLDRVLDDHERLVSAHEEETTTKATMEALDAMPVTRLREVESCARARQETFWKLLGLWPLPPGDEPIRMRKQEE